MQTDLTFSHDDVAYIEANYMLLEERPDDGPSASYVLPDGRRFYPADYFEQERDERRFKERLTAAMQLHGAECDADEIWRTYLTGIYGVCLLHATPENIIRKKAYLAQIELLIAAPKPGDPAWRRALNVAVDALDALERPFSPHHDRVRFGRPPTRDSHIRDVRETWL